jgi:heme-degrading monooxygenase HmoA
MHFEFDHEDKRALHERIEIFQIKQLKMSTIMKQIFIDKFFVPAKAKQEFLNRMNINRSFIKTLNGFTEDAAYERTDEDGNLICITIAVWENEDVLKKAKEAVREEYKKQGFNMPEMLERLHITIDRGLYTKMEN